MLLHSNYKHPEKFICASLFLCDNGRTTEKIEQPIKMKILHGEDEEMVVFDGLSCRSKLIHGAQESQSNRANKIKYDLTNRPKGK